LKGRGKNLKREASPLLNSPFSISPDEGSPERGIKRKRGCAPLKLPV